MSSRPFVISERINEFDRKIMIEAFDEPDEMFAILKLCLELELQLGVMLEEVTGVDCAEMEWYSKVLMLRVLRLPNDPWTLADHFRKLRNKFAHKKGTSLVANQKIVDAILSARLPQSGRTLKGWTFTVVRGATGIEEKFAFDQLTDLRKVAVVAIFLAAFFRTVPEFFEFPVPKPIVDIGKVSSRK